MKRTNKTYTIPPVRVEDPVGKGLEKLARIEKRTFADYIRYRLTKIVEKELPEDERSKHAS